MMNALIPTGLTLLFGLTIALAQSTETENRAWNHYFGSNGYSQDYGQAHSLFELGALAGIPGAHYGLATLYSRGLGVEKDFQLARHHYEQAATGGVRRAYFNLGVMHHKGLGVSHDDVHARGFFEIAAEMKEPHAYYTLGIFNEEGLGGDTNLVKAIGLYHKAAVYGVVGAQSRLDRLTLTVDK